MASVITIPIGPIFSGGPCRGIIHVIEKGDTLYNLGKRYRVSVSSLMFANPYVNVYNLQIGDELCIPVTRPQPRTIEEPMEDEWQNNFVEERDNMMDMGNAEPMDREYMDVNPVNGKF